MNHQINNSIYNFTFDRASEILAKLARLNFSLSKSIPFQAKKYLPVFSEQLLHYKSLFVIVASQAAIIRRIL